MKIDITGDLEIDEDLPREFEEARVKDGYLYDPMCKHKRDRTSVEDRRWRKMMEDKYEY